MRCEHFRPGRDGPLGVEDVAEPAPEEGGILVEAVAIGVCGTDRRLARRGPALPPGRDRLVIGHESLGRARETPPGSGFEVGDLVVGMVHGADPVPCSFCAAGEPDLCDNGGFTDAAYGNGASGSELFRLGAGEAVRL